MPSAVDIDVTPRRSPLPAFRMRRVPAGMDRHRFVAEAVSEFGASGLPGVREV
ncbi:hypothetical protein [Kitasatospora sp. NPDC048538]|uniref:hypothetical protein n=1 Tax=unclassified Kitasatospora TaxID=2633591 RepID=UPI0033DD75E1